MIICCGGIKGGSGKTTVATNLAVMRSAELRRRPQDADQVLLIDADDQETAADFTELRTERKGSAGYTCIRLSGPSVRNETLKLRGKYRDIIIDTGGRDTASQRAALAVADLALIPFVPRSFDVWTLEKITALVEEMGQANPKLKAWTFLNRADPRGQDNQAAGGLLAENPSLQFVECPLRSRKAVSNAQSQGLGVLEVIPEDLKAISEMQALYAQVFAAGSKTRAARKGSRR